MSKSSAHPSLNEKENIIAFVGGIGLVLIIGAALVAALGTQADNSRLNVLAIFGAAALVGSLVLWLAMLRPWENFDDLKTPLFTGHHDHEEPH